MTIFVRGCNPIWSLVDLTGHQFDDTFYMFVLENTIPYIPSTVYHDVSGTIPWNNPIQFLANGTLPVDIYWNPDLVYRLEFRQGDTQTDPLIYEVNNYTPGGSGITPVDTSAIASDNQVTNPQFSLISFASPYSQTSITDPDPIEVAPGWFLKLAGTGNVALERVALTATQANETNAPYALRITLSGSWSASPYLYQRFNENGMLWSTFTRSRYVASSITAKVDGAPQSILAQLYDSMGTALTTVLDDTTLNGTYNEYTGTGLMPSTTNTNTPPAAYIEYRLFLPTSIDVYVTSIQLVSTLSNFHVQYIQETIERQQDHTFHYYLDSLLQQQKQSVLTGWDFGLNPWQFSSATSTNLPTFGYIADQTIMFQQAYVASAAGNNIATNRGSLAQNYGFKVTAVTATNQFAMIQYIDPTSIRTGWGKTFSSMVKLVAQLQGTVSLKMRLIYRASLPSPISQTEPIASWAPLGQPVYAAGWTAISPANDPTYVLTNGSSTLKFEGFELPVSTNASMTLGIVIYTTTPMTQTGTADNIVFNSVSLVQNDFAIETPALSFDETLRRCQFYYRKSFLVGTVPTTNVGAGTGESVGTQVAAAGIVAQGPVIRFDYPMRGTPGVTLFNPLAANNEIRDTSTGTNWVGSGPVDITALGFVAIGTTPGGSALGNGSSVHWFANAVLGE